MIKYLQLSISAYGSGTITGARIQTYMLERPRVTSPGEQERNYHIFYQILRGLPPEQASRFGLDQGVDSFRILSCSGCTEVDGVDDAAEYQATLKSLEAIGATPEDHETLLRCLAAALHTSNLMFEGGDESALVHAPPRLLARRGLAAAPARHRDDRAPLASQGLPRQGAALPRLGPRLLPGVRNGRRRLNEGRRWRINIIFCNVSVYVK